MIVALHLAAPRVLSESGAVFCDTEADLFYVLDHWPAGSVWFWWETERFVGPAPRADLFDLLNEEAPAGAVVFTDWGQPAPIDPEVWRGLLPDTVPMEGARTW